MDLYYKQEISVGVFVLVAIIIMVVGVTWLSGSSLLGGAGQTAVSVRFADVTGLAVGDPVRISGFRMGRVTDIRFQDVGNIVVVLDIPERLRPHEDATAVVASLDFLGAKGVDYTPGTSPNLLAADAVIVGSTASGILEGTAGLADQAAAVLTGLQEFLNEETADQLQRTLAATEAALARLSTLADGPTVREATAALAEVRSVATRVDSILANPSIEQSINQLDEVTIGLQEMTEGLAGMSASMSAIMRKIDAGEGTLGKAVNDSTLHTDIHELLNAMTELLDDMRLRPGRYFRLTAF